jgi:hypothetical protein
MKSGKRFFAKKNKQLSENIDEKGKKCFVREHFFNDVLFDLF